MGNLIPLFSGDRAAGKRAHDARGLNPDYGLGLPDDRSEAEVLNAERRSLFRAAMRAAERGLAAEDAYCDAMRSDRPASELAGFRAESERLRAEAAWTLSLLDTPAMRGGGAA